MRPVAFLVATLVALAGGVPAMSALGADPAASPPVARLVELQITGSMQIVADGGPMTTLTVTPGETVVFSIDNTAGFAHEIRIGTEAQLGSAQAAELPGIPSWTDGIRVFTWEVPEETYGLLLGCVEPGHLPLERVRIVSTAPPPSPIPLPIAGPDGAAFGLGGRVELPDDGFALTFPTDWAWLRHPPGGPTDWLTPYIEHPSSDRSGASLAESLRFRGSVIPAPLIGIGPMVGAATAWYEPSCQAGLFDAGVSTLADAIARVISDGQAAQGTPVAVTVPIPGVERAVRFDLVVPGDPSTEALRSLYLFDVAGRVPYLMCDATPAHPEDRWLPLAQTFEPLP